MTINDSCWMTKMRTTMDNRANIRPLAQFPEDERAEAIERLQRLEDKRFSELKTMLTDEGIAKIEAMEAEIERRVLEGDKE